MSAPTDCNVPSLIPGASSYMPCPWVRESQVFNPCLSCILVVPASSLVSGPTSWMSLGSTLQVACLLRQTLVRMLQACLQSAFGLISICSCLNSLGRIWTWFQTPLDPLPVSRGHPSLLAHLLLACASLSHVLPDRRTDAKDSPEKGVQSPQIIFTTLSAVEDSSWKTKSHLNTVLTAVPHCCTPTHLPTIIDITCHYFFTTSSLHQRGSKHKTIHPQQRLFSSNRHPTIWWREPFLDTGTGLTISSRVTPLSGLTERLIMPTKPNTQGLNCHLTLQRKKTSKITVFTALSISPSSLHHPGLQYNS